MQEITFPEKYSLLQQKLRLELENRFEEEAYMLERLLLESFSNQTPPSPDQVLSKEEIDQLEAQVQRLFEGEPIQYILEKGHFYGRDFKVNSSVLIPRRETEELMVWVRDTAKEIQKIGPLCILDIGSGSGCISISLDLELSSEGKELMVWGMDKSEEAIEIARENTELFGASCQFFEGDILLLTPADLGKWDIIVSNPPYIPISEKEDLAPRVKDHEPEIALYVPDKDPLRFYKKIITLGKKCLNKHGHLFFEIHEDFGGQVWDLLKKAGYNQIELRKDLQGKDRMFCARA